MGFGWFSKCGLGLLPALTQKGHHLHHLHQHHTSPSSVTDHICLCYQSLQSERVVIIISLPVPWVFLLCQHARSVPACQRVILEVSELPWACFPEVLDVLKAKLLCHCARWLKIHMTVLMAQIDL